jgi:hypothetical protein
MTESPKDRLLDRLHRLLSQCRSELDGWHERNRRLLHRVAKVPLGVRYRSEFEEASAATLLVSLQLKAHVMTNIALARLPVLADDERQERLREFVTAHAVDIRDALFERHLLGLGVLQLYTEADEYRLRHVPLEHVYVDPRHGFRSPPFVIRKILGDDGDRWEYFDDEIHAMFTEDEIESLHANILGEVPFYLVPSLMAGSLYPIGDSELALPQQLLLDEVRRTVLNSARRNQPLMEYRVGDIEEAELDAIESGERLIIGTASGQSLRPIGMPFTASEWTALEQLARSDMDVLLGIRDILRSTLTSGEVTMGKMTATQALAEIALQSARLAADSLEVECALRRISEHWHRLAYQEPPRYAFIPRPENPLDTALQAGSDIAGSIPFR